MTAGIHILRYFTGAVSIILLSCSPRVIQSPPEEPPEIAEEGKFVPGDAIRIITPLDSTSFISGIFPIDNNGFAFIPILGNIQVTNKTPDELTEYIRSSLEEYLRFPEMQIQPLIRVSLQGGFVRPGFYHIEPERSIWDLIALAGGTTSENGLKRMMWERNHSIIKINMLPDIESGKSLRMVGFRSGDQLLTPIDTRSFMEMFVSYILPIATFGLSLFLGIIAVQNGNQ